MRELHIPSYLGLYFFLEVEVFFGVPPVFLKLPATLVNVDVNPFLPL
jgi:hypothetical protein